MYSDKVKSSCYSRFIALTRVICFVSILIVAGCADGETRFDEESDSAEFVQVLDQEGLFSPDSEAELATLMDSLEGTSGLDLMVVTVGEEASDGLLDYAAFQKNRLKAGEKGLNNGGIIFLSDYNREVKVEMGFGMEWMISDTAAGRITTLMTPDLSAGNYLEAISIGLFAIATESTADQWSNPQGTWNWSDSLELGQLVRLTGKAIGRAYQEGVPESAQFHPNYYVEVYQNQTDNEPVFLLFSRYMTEMVDLLVYGDNALAIIGRVMGKDPYVIALTGTESIEQEN